MVLPVTSFGQPLGHLWLAECDQPFNADDAQLIYGVIDDAMPLLERADLMEQLQREGAIKERERIGRDLHDSAVQPYVGLKYGLEALARTAGSSNPVLAAFSNCSSSPTTSCRTSVTWWVVCARATTKRAGSADGAIERQAKRFETIYGVE